MSDAMVVLLVLASGTFVLKSAGPVLLGAERLLARRASLRAAPRSCASAGLALQHVRLSAARCP